MKFAIYHPFTDFHEYYSLSHVIKEQMLMLTEAGHECHFITHRSFKGKVPKKVTVHPLLWKPDDWRELYDATEEIISQMDYVFTHDIVYLGSYKIYDSAIREYANNHDKPKWLHWSHSAPNPSEPREPMENSLYIGLNAWDLERLAEQYNVPLAKCRLVYNPRSPDVVFGWHPFTKKLVEKHDLLDCDILMVQPFDTGRWEAKGGPKVLKLIQKLRDRKLNAKVVFINSAADTKDRRKMVQDIHKKHSEYAIFTSLESIKYYDSDGKITREREFYYEEESQRQGFKLTTTTHTPAPDGKVGKWVEMEFTPYEKFVPHRVVIELMKVGNVFPLLSVSEGCSLTLLEAGLCGMIMILNADFPPFQEFGRIDYVFWMKVSSDRATTNYGRQGEDGYYAACAQNLQAMYERSPAHRFKQRTQKRFNRHFIWRNQLAPLLEEVKK